MEERCLHWFAQKLEEHVAKRSLCSMNIKLILSTASTNPIHCPLVNLKFCFVNLMYPHTPYSELATKPIKRMHWQETKTMQLSCRSLNSSRRSCNALFLSSMTTLSFAVHTTDCLSCYDAWPNGLITSVLQSMVQKAGSNGPNHISKISVKYSVPYFGKPQPTLVSQT